MHQRSADRIANPITVAAEHRNLHFQRAEASRDAWRLSWLLTGSAKQAIAEAAETTGKQLADATLLEYGPAVLVPPQHWMHVADTDAATLGVIESVVAKQDLKLFDGDAPYAQNLKLIAARFTTDDLSIRVHSCA